MYLATGNPAQAPAALSKHTIIILFLFCSLVDSPSLRLPFSTSRQQKLKLIIYFLLYEL